MLFRSVLVVLIFLLGSVAYVLISPTGRGWIDTLTGQKSVPVRPPYTCPLIQEVTETEIATCKDCTFYPVDKTHALPATYAPTLVDTGLPGGGKIAPIARSSLIGLFADAKQRGLFPMITSAYRSYDDQVLAFSSWVNQEWASQGNLFLAIVSAESYSAYPGHSEHQLGTALDVDCDGCVAFDTTDKRNIALWKFLEDNAYRYGFVISYPRDMADRTGYIYEPWHIRFIGIDNATELYKQGYLQGNGTCAWNCSARRNCTDETALTADVYVVQFREFADLLFGPIRATHQWAAFHPLEAKFQADALDLVKLMWFVIALNR